VLVVRLEHHPKQLAVPFLPRLARVNLLALARMLPLAEGLRLFQPRLQRFLSLLML
jgi:hypothetical protein